MADYTFLNLSPAEFESLCRDLLQKKLGVHIESFTTGRDNGIDLRYSIEPNSKAIIQCKRYSGYSQLLSNLKKEIQKLPALSPTRYLLCTSVGLTPNNKNEIVQLFLPYIKDSADIFGASELNGFLRDYHDVEINHFKLWFGSTQILDKLLSNRILSRSNITEDDIRKNTCVYVPTPCFTKAAAILDEHKYVVISGIPGIGKTTLARMLTLQFLAKDFHFVDVSFDIDEAHERFGKEERQVFYYDDFLGKNFLEEGLRKNEDRRLVNFINRIRTSKNKILLMTTREYILNQAKQKYELFKDGDLDIAKCIVDIENYNKVAKAQILYNHLFFSGLTQNYLDAIISGQAYRKIIGHANYNPRLIQFMTKREISNMVPSNEFLSKFLHNLDHPSRIWEDAFNTQIRQQSKMALFTLALSLRTISERDFFTALSAVIGLKGELLTLRLFQDILKELEGTFINIVRDGRGTIWISFLNPSVFDFIIEEINREKPIQQLCISAARFFNQLLDIFRMPWKKYPIGNQILLDVALAAMVEKRIIDDFEILGELEQKGNFWKPTLIERCEQLSRRFPPKEHPAVAQLCVRLFNSLSIDSSMTSSDKEALADLLFYIGDYIDKDHREIVSSFFLSLENSHDAASFIKLRDFDGLAFHDFCFENKEAIHAALKESVESDVNSFLSSADEISGILEDIEAIESEFSEIYFDKVKLKLKQEKEEKEAEELAKNEYNYEHWRGNTQSNATTQRSEDNEIDSLFDSLIPFSGDA